jgi:hypothetical protein
MPADLGESIDPKVVDEVDDLAVFEEEPSEPDSSISA